MRLVGSSRQDGSDDLTTPRLGMMVSRWKGLVLLGLVLTLTGGAISALEWRTSRIVASYDGVLSSCVSCAYPYDYQDILRASAGDVFKINFTCKEKESEVFVAVLSKSAMDKIVPHEFENLSLRMLRDQIKASAKRWAEGHSGSFEWTVDVSGSYGWIVVAYRALVSLEGSWEIGFKIVIEQSRRDLAIAYVGYAGTVLGIVLTISVLLLHSVRKRHERMMYEALA